MVADFARERAEAIRSGQIESPEELLRLVRSEPRGSKICLDAFLDRVESWVYEEDTIHMGALAELAPDLVRSKAPRDKDRQVRAWALASAAKLLAGDLDAAEEHLVDHALKDLPPGSLESPWVWARWAAVKAERGQFKSARKWTAKALEFLRQCDPREIRSCDRHSMAAVLLENALIMQREGRSAREVARELLQALFLSTPGTSGTRDAAARHLAVHCGRIWLEGNGRLSPGPLLESVKRVRKMLEIEGGTVRSRCYARLQWVEAMTLSALAQGLTRIAFNKFVTAKGYLVRMKEARDTIWLNLDLAYWLLREKDWPELAVIVDELLELAVAENRPQADVESLRRWKLGIEEGRADRELAAEIYGRMRGVRKLALREPDGGEPGVEKGGKWYSPHGW